MLTFNDIDIEWLGHASFKLKHAGKVIYLDPWEVEEYETADLILITHAHYDHYSPEDVQKLSGEQTVIIAPHDVAAKIGKKAKAIAPGETMKIGDIKIDAVPAYNLARFRTPGVPFHPKENHWCGYVIRLGHTRIYHAGDTDKIPEMEDIRADVALLPIGGTYTMDPKEAAEAANTVWAKLAIPMHWGKIVGSKEDVDEFAKLCQVEVRSLDRFQTQ